MLLFSSVALLLASSVSSHVVRSPASSDAMYDGSSPQAAHWGCGNAVNPPPLPKERREYVSLTPRDVQNRTITIDTYVHVIAASTKLEDGFVSNRSITDQILVLNSRYAPSGISFVLKGSTHVVSPKWSINPNDTVEIEMRRHLRKGDYKTLNLYFMKDVGNRTLGRCYFPREVKPGSDEFYIDGCNARHNTITGGLLSGYEQGITTVHEVGHWLGLRHTFQGGCGGVGDGVDDTPAEATASFECTIGRNTCPGRKGFDPIHNYMDYTKDACKSNFTPGQTARMHSQWAEYRERA